MPRPSDPRLFTALIITLCFAVISCGDDPELVAKRDQQQAELRRLEGELMLLEQKLDKPPPDRREDLEALEAQIARDRAEIASLEEQVPELEARRRELELELQQYQRDYPLR